MKKHPIDVNRTAYYFTEGNLENPHDLWIVCHGYGQTADDFIRPFTTLDLNSNAIIAPEGLSRFYREGTSGDVVSSWMTKRFRLSEIEDQINYLDGIYKRYASRAENIHILGFSQGVATVSRWLFYSTPEVSSMILWAGWLPEDIPYIEKYDYWKRLRIFYIYGNQDQYVTAERIDTHRNRKDIKVLDLHTITFDGMHRLSRKTIMDLSRNFNPKQLPR